MEINDTPVVCMPAASFDELGLSAYTQPTAGERIAGTAQTLVVISAITAIVPVASYAWVRCQDWLDERRLRREKTGVNLTSVAK